MIHLRSISLKKHTEDPENFPFNVPVLKDLDELEFPSPVTIFVGENGSGKSTLLEGIAKAALLVAVGSEEVDRDLSMLDIQPLADAIKLVWTKRTHRGFFLRTEDFFGFVKRLRSERQLMMDEVARIDDDYQGRSDYAKSLAKNPAISSLGSMERRYGQDLGSQSHGESFLALMRSRMVPGGLYLIDEPEAALSPLSQLGFIALVKEMVAQDSQLILATHSPILMAIPNAMILDFDRSPLTTISYDDLEHVKLYRSFLEDPAAFIHYL